MVPEDLLEFRLAIAKLERVEPTTDRRHEARYAPTGWLARASVRFEQEAETCDADVIDLSPSGIRLALPPGKHFGEGERCQVMISPNASTIWQLDGEIRWVTLHPYITVFGVLLEPDHSPLSAV